MLSNHQAINKALMVSLCFLSVMNAYADVYTRDYEETVAPRTQNSYYGRAQYTTDYEETVLPREDEEQEEYVVIIPDQQPVLINVVSHQQPTGLGDALVQGVAQGIGLGVGHVVGDYVAHAAQDAWGYASVRESVGRFAKTIVSGLFASAVAVAHNLTFEHVINCFADTYGKFGVLGELGLQICCDQRPQGVLDNALVSAASFGIMKALYEYCKFSKINFDLLFKQSGRVFVARFILEALLHTIRNNQSKSTAQVQQVKHSQITTTTTRETIIVE